MFQYIDTRIDLGLILNRLDERQRLVLHRYHIEGYNLREIGEEIGLGESMVHRIMTGAISKAREGISADKNGTDT